MGKIAEIRECKKCGGNFFYHLEKGEGYCGKCDTKEESQENFSDN